MITSVQNIQNTDKERELFIYESKMEEKKNFMNNLFKFLIAC